MVSDFFKESEKEEKSVIVEEVVEVVKDVVNKVLTGDCLQVMKKLESNSVDSIITDPPYGLSFMGKKWDYDVPSISIWKEALRVLKPGGTMLCFAGSGTTGLACKNTGRDFILIERNSDYVSIINARLGDEC